MNNAPVPEGLNLTIDLKLDEHGRPSVQPNDVVKFTQQLLFKAALKMTSNGTEIPDDMESLSYIIRDMNATALTTRKLDQEEEGLFNQKALVEAYVELRKGLSGQNLYTGEGTLVRDSDPYAGILPPSVPVVDGEMSQGEHPLNPDDFLTD